MIVRKTQDTDLRMLLQGDLSSGERHRFVRHLLSTWQACRNVVEELHGEFRPLREARADHPALGDHLRRLKHERQQLPHLAARLLACRREQQRSLLRTDPDLQCWSLGEHLLEECHKFVYIDISQAERLADLALTVAEELDPAIYGDELINDLKARSWGAVGEVLRILSDLRGADEAFAIAENFISDGTGDALEEAGLLELKAALWRDQRRTSEAHQILDQVIAIYRHYRDFHLVGRAFVQKGRVYGADNDLILAVRWLRQGLGLIDSTRERFLELAARHSLMLYLHECGQHQEAWFLLKASRSEFLGHGGPLLSLRLLWLEGKIQHALGFLAEAEADLLAARSGFIEQGIGFSAAVVSLDLAALYAGQQRAEEMRRLAEEMLVVFRSRDLHREAIGALIVFQQAVRMENLDADLLDQIRSYLRRARKDHKLRFEYTA